MDERIQICDGFDRLNTWNAALYKKKKNGLAIYSLHGSLSWVEVDGRVVNTRTSSREQGREHLLIYPGFKGNPEAPENHEVFRFPHQALRQTLVETETLIVIGFSFRDPHLNNIFNPSLKRNQALRILVLCPEEPDGLKKMPAAYRKRYKHVPGYFGQPEAFEAVRKALTAAG